MTAHPAHMLTASLRRLAQMVVVLQLAASSSSPAQVVADSVRPPAAGRVQRLVLRDGSELIGKVIAVEGDNVRFESSLGVTTIPLASITMIREEGAGETRDGVYYFPNPNQTRLVFAPTGRQLKQGEGYFSDYWIFFPGFAHGLTDRFTIGGGFSIIPGLSLGDQVWYVTPKVGIVQEPSFNAAVGALATAVPSDDEGNTAGILYGVGTWGKPDASFTAGFGYGFVNDDLADSPIFMFGGESRTSPRVSFVTENYIFPGGEYMVMGGLRFMGRDMSVDLTGAAVRDFCCIPFLGFVWKW